MREGMGRGGARDLGKVGYKGKVSKAREIEEKSTYCRREGSRKGKRRRKR